MSNTFSSTLKGEANRKQFDSGKSFRHSYYFLKAIGMGHLMTVIDEVSFNLVFIPSFNKYICIRDHVNVICNPHATKLS